MADSPFRPYEKARDLDAVRRMWREVGWTTSDHELAIVEPFFDVGRTLVYEQDGAAEAACHITPGAIRYQDRDLRLAGVTAVTTSHVARRQGVARRLLAQMLAEEAAGGAQVAALGIFDQGFYDQVGFGTSAYGHRFRFDPTTLQVDRRFRVPVRLTVDDHEAMHAAMCARLRGHGGMVLDPPTLLRCELSWDEQTFGFGYRDDRGELTHFVHGKIEGENGPYKVNWVAYREPEQLLELLALLRSLGDQVHEVVMDEPPHLQLQDVLRTPFRDGTRTRGTGFQQSAAWMQLRILDLVGCVEAGRFPGHEVAFNLDLHDPAVDHLPPGIEWEGTAGRFVVTLGASSRCERGEREGLPTLTAGVGAFTRMLFGVRPASVLAVTTDLDGPAELLGALDRTVCLPPPHSGWDF